MQVKHPNTYVTPVVKEIPPPITGNKSSQRELVVASLLARP